MYSPKKRMLFLDDRTERIEKARELYKDYYDLTIVTNVKECLRYLTLHKWDIVSLDFDLNGGEFQDYSDENTGAEIVRWMINMRWIEHNLHTEIRIHSTNLYAARNMCDDLIHRGVDVTLRPFGWKQYQKGVIAGAFSLIHPGYIRLLKEAKELCHEVIVLLHAKPDQVLTVDERAEILLALKYVDTVYVYSTERELDKLLEQIEPDIRIVGSDHEGNTSRPQWKTHYHKRNHGWSASKLKRLIAIDEYQKMDEKMKFIVDRMQKDAE